jgi:hypothetical protein
MSPALCLLLCHVQSDDSTRSALDCTTNPHAGGENRVSAQHRKVVGTFDSYHPHSHPFPLVPVASHYPNL